MKSFTVFAVALLASVIALAVVSPGSADTVVYTDRPSFEAAITGETTVSWNGYVGAGKLGYVNSPQTKGGVTATMQRAVPTDSW